jgi:putative ATP-dependent endonuclease of OLD family
MPNKGAGAFYRGHEQLAALLISLKVVEEDDIPTNFANQETFFAEHNAYVGNHTLEVDIMETGDDAREVMKTVYSELIKGGDEMQENFEEALDNGAYWEALKKIENNVSKGRYAQRLADHLTADMVPGYIKNGLEKMMEIVKETYE